MRNGGTGNWPVCGYQVHRTRGVGLGGVWLGLPLAGLESLQSWSAGLKALRNSGV